MLLTTFCPAIFLTDFFALRDFYSMKERVCKND
jgi:hypothetical protein